ncbi:MAG: sigma-70 family RNA polymerase sigma factor [Amoebophilaceae bacterium TMED152]|nr:RNA polymerase subunit sigma-70 [Flavobacteriales bacterium]MBK56878.1 RNA polymerase subunit sigma-70 [Flavobacteriaceae bacterium]RPH01423.1 MAG: sigma-70 family RNA polymerase sigma factor [Amoebophilaceae bacterium TMED152]
MKKESDLIKNLKNKNTQNVAFENLIQQYKEPLYWHIRRILLDHDDSNDVLQNTFVKVFKGIQNFKGDSKLYTWIYRIATNESINFLKIKSKKYFQGSEEMTNYMLSNLKDDPYFDGDELQLKLQFIISKLPEKQKLVFQMKYEQNMKFKDISEILGTSIGALKASYHIAVGKIKKEIKEIQTF